MEVDEDDDFYAPEESVPASSEEIQQTAQTLAPQTKVDEDEDLEEGEEEDVVESEGSDSVYPRCQHCLDAC